MSLLFIHGVNNRNSDEAYLKGVALRKRMYETVLLPKLKGKYPNFAIESDVYWGGSGVSFTNNLASVPKTDVAEDMGSPSVDPTISNYAEVIETMNRFKKVLDVENKEPGAVQNNEVLVAAVAKIGARQFISLMSSPVYASIESENAIPENAEEENANPAIVVDDPEVEGERTADLLTMFELLSRDEEAIKNIAAATKDADIMNIFAQSMERLVEQGRKNESEIAVVEHMGISDDIASWITNKTNEIKQTTSSLLRKVKNSTIDDPLRASSLLLLKKYRQGLSRNGFLFVGDVFEYLKRGWSDDSNCISTIVREAVKKTFMSSQANKEVCVIVTHSFGSMILYDLLSSNAFDNVNDFKIDLWIMAGSQVSMFAEMRMYKVSPTLPELTKVKSWINVWDPADVVSFLSEPVFGAAVKDIKMRQHAHVDNAHGDYFSQPIFYEHILTALLGEEKQLEAKKLEASKI